jgi:hypothetical protein
MEPDISYLMTGVKECPATFEHEDRDFRAWYRGRLVQMHCSRPGTEPRPHCSVRIDVRETIKINAFTEIQFFDRPITLMETVRVTLCGFHTKARRGPVLDFCTE